MSRMKNYIFDDAPWREQAACKGLWEAFDGDKPELVPTALRICWKSCTVRQECMADAMADPDGMRYGIRGGYTGGQRRAMVTNQWMPREVTQLVIRLSSEGGDEA